MECCCWWIDCPIVVYYIKLQVSTSFGLKVTDQRPFFVHCLLVWAPSHNSVMMANFVGGLLHPCVTLNLRCTKVRPQQSTAHISFSKHNWLESQKIVQKRRCQNKIIFCHLFWMKKV